MSEDNSTCAVVVFVFCLFTVAIIITCLGSGYLKWRDRTCEAKSPDTNETFIVQNIKSEPEWIRQEVANRIGKLAKDIDKLVMYMSSKNMPDQVISHRLKERWAKIRSNPKGLREIGVGETSAAYTVNKGDQIRICIRDAKSDNQFEDKNDMMFVMLHELGHLMSKSYGHNLEFKKNFAYITKIAVDIGIYKYTDYQKTPTNYCGTDISWPSY